MPIHLNNFERLFKELKRIHEESEKPENRGNREFLVSELCKLSLKSKWKKASNIPVNDRCAFCWFETYKVNLKYFNAQNTSGIEDASLRCETCVCPPEICCNNAETGYIAELEDYAWISDIPPAMLEHMISLFTKHII